MDQEQVTTEQPQKDPKRGYFHLVTHQKTVHTFRYKRDMDAMIKENPGNVLAFFQGKRGELSSQQVMQVKTSF
jgi:hypothetical protein